MPWLRDRCHLVAAQVAVLAAGPLRPGSAETVSLSASGAPSGVRQQGNYAFIGVSGGASASTWTSAASWQQLTVMFTTGSTGAITVFVHGWYSQGNVYADDFSLS